MSEPFVPRKVDPSKRSVDSSTRAGVLSSRAGVLSSRRVRLLSFFLTGVALFVTAAICILAIWEFTSKDAALHSISTLGVITATLFLFTILNEWFGVKIREVGEG